MRLEIIWPMTNLRYQSQLNKTNSVVREHNTRVMPALLDQLQAGARWIFSWLIVASWHSDTVTWWSDNEHCDKVTRWSWQLAIPALLDETRRRHWRWWLFRERLGLLCKGLTSYMKAEQEMFVILGKCQKEVIRWEKCQFKSWTLTSFLIKRANPPAEWNRQFQ